MDPINYTDYMKNVQTPFQAAVQGYSAGAGMRTDQFQQQQLQIAMQRQRAMQTDSAAIAQNPNAPDYATQIANLSVKYPEFADQFKKTLDMVNPAQQKAHVDQAGQVYAAVASGRPDIGANLLQQRADALRNSGDEKGAQTQEDMAKWLQLHPDSFKFSTALMLSNALGPEQFAQQYGQLGTEQRAEAQAPYDQAKAAANVADIDSQIQARAANQKLDQDKLLSETQTKLKGLELQYGTPPDDARKLINTAAVQSAADSQSSARLDDIASRLDQTSRLSGLAGSTAEILKKVYGGDGVTALKQEYARIANSNAITQIKQAMGSGSRITNVDVKLALSTTPGPNASPEVIASYLRGTAMLQRISAAQNNAQAEWLAQNRHLGPASKDLTIEGVQVPAGTTFPDFTSQFVQKKADELQAHQALTKTQGRSYMRFAQPQEAPGTAASGQ